MSYEVNARITLPASMGSAQICELNVGRYNSFDAAMEQCELARIIRFRIVQAVLDALYDTLEMTEDQLAIAYFVRA